MEPIPLRQIQELLPDPETAIVELFLTGEQLLAFVVTRGAISHQVIEEFTPQDLADQWRRWIEGYQRFRDYGDRRAWLQTLDEVLKGLYDKMFRYGCRGGVYPRPSCAGLGLRRGAVAPAGRDKPGVGFGALRFVHP